MIGLTWPADPNASSAPTRPLGLRLVRRGTVVFNQSEVAVAVELVWFWEPKTNDTDGVLPDGEPIRKLS